MNAGARVGVTTGIHTRWGPGLGCRPRARHTVVMSPRRWFYAGTCAVVGLSVAFVLARRSQLPAGGAVVAGVVAALGIACLLVIVAALSGRD
jgi:hypothetical protein